MDTTFLNKTQGPLQSLGSRYGLHTPIVFGRCLDDAIPILRFGSWCFRAQRLFEPDKYPAQTGGITYIFYYPGSFDSRTQKDGCLKLEPSLSDKYRLAILLAQSIRIQSDYEKRFWRWVAEIYPHIAIVDMLPSTPKSYQWLKDLFWQLLHFSGPIELRARWYGFCHWQEYYQVLWRSSFSEDSVSEYGAVDLQLLDTQCTAEMISDNLTL